MKVSKILDHGYLKLIDSMGTEESIIEAARMSTGKGFEGWDKDEKLLTYLYKNKHMSPFEMCELVVEVQAPLFVVREWQRHRTFSFNEFSARYAVMPDLHYVPEHVRAQSTTNKQGSGSEIDKETAEWFMNAVHAAQGKLYCDYNDAIERGVARELARINTPLSRYTRMRVKGNLRNWLQFLDLRMRENAQYEIRVYAEAVAEVIEGIWPRTYNLFEEYTLFAKTLSRTEAALENLK